MVANVHKEQIKLKTDRNESHGLGFEISHEEDGMVEEV
jgi:hypothetical protein